MTCHPYQAIYVPAGTHCFLCVTSPISSFGILGCIEVNLILKGGNSMPFWYIKFAIEWLVWLIFADKRRWRELFSVFFCFFANGNN
jgi:hypothetical protein